MVINVFDESTGAYRVGCSIYSDFPSKLNNQPCMHLEFKVCGTSLVRREKVETPGDLFRFSHLRLGQRILRLYEIDFAALGRLQRGGRRTKSGDFRAGHLIALWARRQTNEPFITAQSVRLACRMHFEWFNPERVFNIIDPACILFADHA